MRITGSPSVLNALILSHTRACMYAYVRTCIHVHVQIGRKGLKAARYAVIMQRAVAWSAMHHIVSVSSKLCIQTRTVMDSCERQSHSLFLQNILNTFVSSHLSPSLSLSTFLLLYTPTSSLLYSIYSSITVQGHFSMD